LGHKKRVYVETTIASYLTSRPSTDILGAAWQKATKDWWETRSMADEILREVWAVKDAISREHKDVRSLVRHLRQRRRPETQPVVNLAEDREKTEVE